jgi:hypothetical protein
LNYSEYQRANNVRRDEQAAQGQAKNGGNLSIAHVNLFVLSLAFVEAALPT